MDKADKANKMKALKNGTYTTVRRGTGTGEFQFQNEQQKILSYT